MQRLSEHEYQVIQETLSSRGDLRLVYSLVEAHQAGGNSRLGLDLGLLFLETLTAAQCEDARLQVIESLAVLLNSPGVGAIVLNLASANISYSAISGGELLYCRTDGDRSEFELDVRGQFQRMVYNSSNAAWRARSKSAADGC